MKRIDITYIPDNNAADIVALDGFILHLNLIPLSDSQKNIIEKWQFHEVYLNEKPIFKQAKSIKSIDSLNHPKDELYSFAHTFKNFIKYYDLINAYLYHRIDSKADYLNEFYQTILATYNPFCLYFFFFYPKKNENPEINYFFYSSYLIIAVMKQMKYSDQEIIFLLHWHYTKEILHRFLPETKRPQEYLIQDFVLFYIKNFFINRDNLSTTITVDKLFVLSKEFLTHTMPLVSDAFKIDLMIALYQCLGKYPLGSFVQLSDDSIALIIQSSPTGKKIYVMPISPSSLSKTIDYQIHYITDTPSINKLFNFKINHSLAQKTLPILLNKSFSFLKLNKSV